MCGPLVARFLFVAAAMSMYWPLSAWYFFYFAFLGAFNTYLGLYFRSVGISPLRIGILLSLLPVMRMVAPNFWGWLADRWGARAAVIKVAVATAFGLFCGIFFASDFWGFLVALSAFALFWSAPLPLIEALTLAHLKRQVEHYGRIRLWGSVGFIFTVQGVGILLDGMPIDWLPAICLALLGMTALSSFRLSEAPASPRPGGGMNGPTTLLSPQMLALLGACFMMSVAHAPLYIFYSIHLVEHGYSKTAVGGLWALGVVAEIFVFLWMPRLLRYWSIRGILASCFLLALIRFLLIGWWVDVLWVALLAQLMHGATFGACHASAVAALNQWFHDGQQAQAQALYSSISFGAGGLVGGLMSGAVWEMAGAGATYSLASLCGAAGLVLVLWGLRGEGHAAMQRRAVP